MDTRILSVLEKLKEEWDITPREDYNIEDGIYRRKRNAREAHALVIVWLNSLPVTLFELERILVILQQQKVIESFRLGEEILTINFPVNFDEKYIELTTKQGKKEESSTPNLEKLEDVVENEKKRCLKIESGDKHRMFRDRWLNTKRVFDTLHTKLLSGLDGKEKKEISISSEEFSTHRVSERQKHIIPETIENLEQRNIISSRRDKEGNWILEIKDAPALRECHKQIGTLYSSIEEDGKKRFPEKYPQPDAPLKNMVDTSSAPNIKRAGSYQKGNLRSIHLVTESLEPKAVIFLVLDEHYEIPIRCEVNNHEGHPAYIKKLYDLSYPANAPGKSVPYSRSLSDSISNGLFRLRQVAQYMKANNLSKPTLVKKSGDGKSLVLKNEVTIKTALIKNIPPQYQYLYIDKTK